MKKRFLLILLDLCAAITVFSQTVTNGIPWYDQNGKPVSAHGANIIRDGGRYYMFGEYKTDSANIFTGFSCYSSDNLSDWHFEGIAFSQQKDGRMGPNRVGERPKVLKCPKTGEYIMLMHTDNMQYKDPCTCYATSRTITGPYEFQGPILYKGKPVTKWDIGSFVDDDGHAYLLVHHGMIYRLSEDFHSLDSCLMSGVKGAGESPAMMKKDGIYYWMSSHTTSWERNDNMYWTATSLGGPWTYRGEFCPVGSLTWNSQCSFLLTLDGGRWMYMGDRWSFPRQHQAATYVWLPVEANKGKLSIPEYMESWDVFTGKPVNLPLKTIAKGRTLRKPGDTYIVKFNSTRIGLKGNTDENSGYAEVTILDGKKQVVFQTSVDFYSNAPATGLRWLSPVLPNGKYTLQVRCSEMKPNWTDKKHIIYGSKGHKVEICEVVTSSNQQRQSLRQSFLTPPDSIRVGCYYYWVNEHVDPKGVVADLQWMKQNGITLAFLATDIRNRTRWERPWEGETFGKNKFQSKLWWKNLRTALKTAGELGIEMGIFNCPGWSQSGGPWIKPEETMRNWTPNGIEICKTKQGTDVACGPCSDEAEGLEVDKLSKTHVKKHFEAFFGEILRRIPQKDRPTLTTVVVDSWERGKQNYTDSIFVKFRQRFGYELDYTNKTCQKDLDRLITELVASEYMGGLTEKAHEYGLRTWCEPYAHSPFPGNSITYGSVADEVAAEFWVNDRKFRQKEVDAAVGAARKSGKNRIWAESFTDGAWDKVAQDDWSFEKLKPIADRYFHAGINATILHVMISQPGDDRKPAVRPWFGTFFDRRSQNTKDLKPLVQYLRRCNFMLQLGRPYNNATDQRIMDDGTIIRFTDDSQFEVTFPDGSKELWNPCQ
jgi:hypothetical protein